MPSSPVLKRARNSFTDINSPFYTEVADCNYQVFIDHVWDEEGPVDITVPKVTVKRMRKPNLPFIGATSKQQKVTYAGCIGFNICIRFVYRRPLNFYNCALEQAKQKW